jgi:hypothetical protein
VASGSYTELVGGNDELAVSVPQIKFVGGMRMTEIVKDLKLTGCEQITLDTCTLDASSTANTLAVSNDIILGSKVSIAAESLATSVSDPHQTLQSEPTTRWPCRRNDITLRLNDGTKWNEYAFSSRFDGALLLNGHDIDIIPKDVLSGLTFVPAHWTLGGGELKHPSFRPAFRTYPPVAQYPKFSDLTFSNSVATEAGRLL